jgi:hypothetical protein
MGLFSLFLLSFSLLEFSLEFHIMMSNRWQGTDFFSQLSHRETDLIFLFMFIQDDTEITLVL